MSLALLVALEMMEEAVLFLVLLMKRRLIPEKFRCTWKNNGRTNCYAHFQNKRIIIFLFVPSVLGSQTVPLSLDYNRAMKIKS
jgi:hypothetical protein